MAGTSCTEFRKALEEETIKLIDYYETQTDRVDIRREKVPVQMGFYIIDQYAEGEMCNENYPAEPMIPIKYCPYCGEKIIYENV